MNAEHGTLAQALGKVASILSPLSTALRPEQAISLLASLGVVVTPADAASLTGPLEATNGQLRAFLDVINEISAATDPEIINAKCVEAIGKLALAFGAVAELAIAVGGLPGVPPGTADELPERLFNFLLAEHLGSKQLVNELLEFMGILEREDFNVDSTDPSQPFYTINTFHFDRVGGWLTGPGSQLANLYDWGTPGFDGTKLLRALDRLIAMLGLPVRYDDSGPLPLLDLVNLEITPRTDLVPRGLVVRLKDKALPSALELAGEDWTVGVATDLVLLSGSELLVQPGGAVRVKPPEATTTAGRLDVVYTLARPPAQPLVLLGRPGGSRIDAQKIELRAGAGFAWDGVEARGSVDVGGKVTGGKLAIAFGEGDGFLGALLSGVALESAFDLGVAYSTDGGLSFTGGGALEIRLPIHRRLGPVTLEGLTFSFGIDGRRFPGFVAADIGASLGPVRVAVAEIGVAIDVVLKEDRSGNTGPADVELSFKPPTGAGIVIEAGPVTGGGFLAIDREAGRYLGALQLRIYEIAVSAFGVIDTKLPGGREGFSFVILISAEFTPIQLGLGFTLNGVGGAIGIHRALSKEALDGAVRSGRLDHILFPSDPAAHAPEILADLQAFFPVAEGRYTFGPLAKIGWGTPTLIEAKVGLILELPHPVRLTLLGTVKAGLPTVEKRFVKLNLALVGQLDFDKKTFALDASLFDSEVGGFAISGDAALRLAWGRDATFALAIGGFNPQFQPPAGFPALRRVMVDISPGGYPRVTCQAYLAITSNTAQVGAKAELTAGGHWNVYGWITFDALFVFVPFSFVVDFSAGVALRQGTKKRASVTVHGMLKGPNPWFVKGKACVSFFFFDICVGFEVTLSEKRPDAIEPAPDLLTKVLVDAVKEVRNWSAELPAECDRVVSLAATVEMVVDPLGALVLRQAALPLRETISRYAGQKLAKEKVATYRIEAVRFEGASGSPDRQVVKDRFARAQFQELADAKKLSLPGFEAMEAGVRIGSDAVRVGRPGDLPVEFETWIVNDASGATKEPAVYQPQPTVVAQLAHVSAAAVGGIRVSGSRRYAVKLGPSAPRVALRAERYTIRSTRTLGEIEDATHPVRVALAEASEALTDVPKGRAQAILRAHVAANPRDRDELQVVAEDDLAA